MRNKTLSPSTAYLCFLLQADRSRGEAIEESRRLGVKPEHAEYWWRNVKR